MAVKAAAAVAGAISGFIIDQDTGQLLETDSDDDQAASSSGMPEEHQCTEGYVPFLSVHKPQPFDTYGRLLYLPGHEVDVSISYYECTPDSHFLGSYLYYIKLKHCKFEWIVTKRYSQFAQLHKELTLHLARLKLPVSSKRNVEDKKFIRQHQFTLPAFPKKPDSLLRGPMELENRRIALEKYLQHLLKIPTFRFHPHMLKFLEVSPLSFVQGLGPKLQEGMVYKVTYKYANSLMSSCANHSHINYKERWLVLKDTYITYLRPETGRVGDVLLMDSNFSVKCGRSDTGLKRGLLIENSTRKLRMQCISDRKAQIWKRNIDKAMATTGSAFTNKAKRYNSFAPERAKTCASWFVDGAVYMSKVADALEKASEEIYITDWWISPELFLKRTSKDGENNWRLDMILKRKAEEGVQIFILIYKELPGTVAIGSAAAKQTFRQINEDTSTSNIHVMRHPDGITKWTHHEKMVVIDQKVAFFGGLDLCFGRWDTSDHLMFYEKAAEEEEVQTVDVLDTMSESSHRHTYLRTVSLPTTNRERLKLQTDMAAIDEDWDQTEEDILIPGSGGTPRSIYYYPTPDTTDHSPSKFSASLPTPLPQQDSSVSLPVFLRQSDGLNSQHSVETSSAQLCSTQNSANASSQPDSCSNPQLLNADTTETEELRHHARGFLQRQMSIDEETLLQDSPDHLGVVTANGGTGNLSRTGSTNSARLPKSHSVDDFTKEKPANENDKINGERLTHLFDRLRAHPNDVLCELELELEGSEDKWKEIMGGKEVARMPWHDIGAVVYGKAARDVARHFIQRWNFTKREKEKTKHFYPMLVPKTYTQVPVPRTVYSESSLCSCQVLRSSDKWSAGLAETESSIQNAYVSTILNAKHYIYIENQFFITVEEPEEVKNSVADALYKRIRRAHENHETFRVYVVMPLMPVVEGKAEGYITPAIQVICYWTYQSICRSEKSLMGRLKEAGVEDPSEYITFYGLRKWYFHEEKLSTELVYVHSKLLIADDKTVLLGSANINDRSLLGSRDSEIAVVFNDQQFFNSKMNGQDYQAGYFAATLRRFLFKEHLGISKEDKVGQTGLKDPVIESFFKDVWLKTAKQNTSTYEKVFRCLPSNKVLSLEDMDEYRRQATMAEMDPDAAHQLLQQQVRGQLVIMPLDFIKDSHHQLRLPPLTAKERLVPNDVWI